MNIEVDLFVFWNYDLFPYYVGGKATKSKTHNGRMVYYVPSYCMWVDPLIVTDIETGEKFRKELHELTNERWLEEEILKNKYKKLLANKLITFNFPLTKP
jgi:hypothetical protein